MLLTVVDGCCPFRHLTESAEAQPSTVRVRQPYKTGSSTPYYSSSLGVLWFVRVLPCVVFSAAVITKSWSFCCSLNFLKGELGSVSPVTSGSTL